MNDIFGLVVSTLHAQEAWQDETPLPSRQASPPGLKPHSSMVPLRKYVWVVTTLFRVSQSPQFALKLSFALFTNIPFFPVLEG